MKTLINPESVKWVVAHNNNDIFHISKVEPNNSLITGQPYMNIFDSEEDLLSAFPNLSSDIVMSFVETSLDS